MPAKAMGFATYCEAEHRVAATSPDPSRRIQVTVSVASAYKETAGSASDQDTWSWLETFSTPSTRRTAS